MKLKAFTQTIEWLGLRFDVPRDWQIARHSIEPRAGQLVFIDSRQQRLTFAWSRTETPPDLGQLIAVCGDRERAERGGVWSVPLALPTGWHGLNYVDEDGDVLSFAVHFDHESSRLVEFVLVGATEERNRDLLLRMLRTFRVTAVARQARRWQAFGLCLTTPPGFRLASTRIEPAEVSMRFAAVTPDLGVVEAVARRIDKARSRFDGDLRSVLERHRGSQHFDEMRMEVYAGHPALLASGFEVGPPVLRFLGKLRLTAVLVWTVEQENALYEIATLSPKKYPVHPQDFEVYCQLGAVAG